MLGVRKSTRGWISTLGERHSNFTSVNSEQFLEIDKEESISKYTCSKLAIGGIQKLR